MQMNGGALYIGHMLVGFHGNNMRGKRECYQVAEQEATHHRAAFYEDEMYLKDVNVLADRLLGTHFENFVSFAAFFTSTGRVFLCSFFAYNIKDVRY